MPRDDGHAVHYTAVRRGTPVYGSDGVEAGAVAEVLDNYQEHIMDGVVIRCSDGERRFVDALEVARTAERAVRLTIPARDVESLPPPPKPHGPLRGLRRLFDRARRP